MSPALAADHGLVGPALLPSGQYVRRHLGRAAAIRAAFDLAALVSRGQAAPTVPRLKDTAKARECAQTIAGWKPLPANLQPLRLRPSKRR